ncbi:hypothetical protein AB0393_24575 [Streptomyces cyaneofuscatus]|uniref:hypothetical protein n=1 Tax=Streptomyces TaxID=1883 RepID=UPI003450DBCC
MKTSVTPSVVAAGLSSQAMGEELVIDLDFRDAGQWVSRSSHHAYLVKLHVAYDRMRVRQHDVTIMM